MQPVVYKSLVLAAVLLMTVSCSKENSESIQTPTQVSEFTAFHPVTGLPLKAEDLTAEMLREDADYGVTSKVDDKAEGEIQAMEVHETEVDVEKSKNILLFGYTPDGSYNSHITPQCYRTEVDKIVSSYNGPTSNLAQSLQSWANRCERELSRYNTNNIAAVLKFANTKYDITGNTIKNIDIEFEDLSRIKAMLGLKSGKRPLVIFKSGVYSNAADGEVTRNFFMHLFEESPFHILYLASVTGTDYMKQNGAVALGGMDEGRQIQKIVDMVSADPRYKDLIEDIHVVGVSLGSHGVLYSSLYNSFEQNSKTKIKSAIALCPVVNLEPTIKSVFEPTIAGIYYAILTNQTLKDVYDRIPILRQYLDPSGLWTQKQMYDASTKSTLWHYKEKTSKTPLNGLPFEGKRVHDFSDFWEYNNFVQYVDQVTTPTLIVHSRDDFLVQSIFNSDELLKKTQNKNSQVGIVEFQNGSHCALNVATGWQTVSSMLRSFILKHSTYKEEEGVKVTVPFRAPYLNSNHKISKFTFAAAKDNSFAQVEIQYFDGSEVTAGTPCMRYDPLFAPDLCYKSKTESVDLNIISGVRVPKTDFEVKRLTRWLNTHVSLLNKNSELVIGSNLWPTSIEASTKPDFQN
ncbi:MAG: hypothetical protein V4596_03420 [Bdellovibrionota bacterium]